MLRTQPRPGPVPEPGELRAGQRVLREQESERAWGVQREQGLLRERAPQERVQQEPGLTQRRR